MPPPRIGNPLERMVGAEDCGRGWLSRGRMPIGWPRPSHSQRKKFELISGPGTAPDMLGNVRERAMSEAHL